MQVNTANSADIVVVTDSNVLANKALRGLLDREGATAVSVGASSGVSVQEKALQLAAEGNGSWIIVLLGASNQANYQTEVLTLISGGADDVVVAVGKNCIATIEQSIERARTTLALSAAIMRTNHVLGRSGVMQAVRKGAARCIQSQALPVLILGETGTGKGQVAKAIHDADPRRQQQPFHTLECGGITDSLLGSELFGHVRGAYTGALENRRGAFECADKGTLLLDEIGELSLTAQSYLLNALQERCYRPVGSDQKMAVRCRFIAATNRSLIEEVEQGSFRRDLFYRLNGNCIRMPALRDHISDVPDLFRHFVAAARWHEPAPDVEPAVIQFLQSQEYPGNIRELDSIAQQTAVRMGGERLVRLAHLPLDHIQGCPPGDSTIKTIESMVRQGMQMRDIESEVARQATQAALRFWTGRQPDRSRTQIVQQVARSLGVSARTVYNKLNGVGRPS